VLTRGEAFAVWGAVVALCLCFIVPQLRRHWRELKALELEAIDPPIVVRQPEHVVRFHGGPCDGARLTMTETLSRVITMRGLDGGEYAFDSMVSMPDGGTVIAKVWSPGEPRPPRPVPGCDCETCEARRRIRGDQ
jgi:hypothetical protein